MSDFTISISAGKDKQSSSVEAHGSTQSIITDWERYKFNLDDSQLKDAVEKHFGRRPKDAYLHSPTGWTDQYKKYNWMQTNRVIAATSAEILEFTSKDPLDLLPAMTSSNSSNLKMTTKAALSQSVSSCARTSWSLQGFALDQKVTYNVGIQGMGTVGETSVSFTAPWGEDGLKSNNVTLDTHASAVYIDVKPQQTLITILSATPCVMKIRVRYNTYLVGTVAVKYGSAYKGQCVWGLPIEEVMSGGGVSNSLELTEDIELDYLSNFKLTTRDKETNEVILCRYL